MSELKPCPNPACTYNDVELLKLGSMSYVACLGTTCGVTGPSNYCAEEAIAAWNALPRALVWSSEPPQAQGWYWVRSVCSDTGIASPAIAFYYNERECEVSKNYPYQWAGPIPHLLAYIRELEAEKARLRMALMWVAKRYVKCPPIREDECKSTSTAECIQCNIDAALFATKEAPCQN